MLVWTARCKNRICERLSAVRESKSTSNQDESLNPREEINKRQCPHCGYVNDFLGYELVEAEVRTVKSLEKFRDG